MELKIKGKRFTQFSSFNLTLAFDAVASAFSIQLYFDPKNPEHRSLLRPGSYTICTIEHLGDVLLTGYIIGCQLKNEAEKTLAQINGYSLPGLLEDCQFPTESYPVQFDGLTLTEIALKMKEPFTDFGLQIDGWVQEDMDKPYKTTDIKITQTVKEYLGQLASQRNIVLSHSEGGDLLFTRALVENQLPQYTFASGMPGVTFALQFNGQAMHSRITVIKEADVDGGNACQNNVINPYVSISKPAVIEQTSGDDVDTVLAARMALSQELRSIKLTVTIDKWDPIKGELILPNTIISCTVPELFIYNPTKFFIRAIDYIGDSQSMTAVLHCTVPEAYSNTTVTNIFL